MFVCLSFLFLYISFYFCQSHCFCLSINLESTSLFLALCLFSYVLLQFCRSVCLSFCLSLLRLVPIISSLMIAANRLRNHQHDVAAVEVCVCVCCVSVSVSMVCVCVCVCVQLNYYPPFRSNHISRYHVYMILFEIYIIIS